MYTSCTKVVSSSSGKFFETDAPPLVFDLSVSTELDNEPVEDVLNLRMAASFPVVKR